MALLLPLRLARITSWLRKRSLDDAFERNPGLGFFRVRHEQGDEGLVDLDVIGAKAYTIAQCAVIAAEARGHMQASLQACGAR